MSSNRRFQQPDGKHGKLKPAAPRHEFDNVRTTPGPAGWVSVALWVRPIPGQGMGAAMRALADAFDTQEKPIVAKPEAPPEEAPQTEDEQPTEE